MSTMGGRAVAGVGRDDVVDEPRVARQVAGHVERNSVVVAGVDGG